MSDTDIGAKIDAVVNAGRAEFGAQDFDDQAGFLVALAADKNDLRHALAVLPDAHKLVAQLNDDPDEAERILSLRGVELARALGKYSVRSRTAAAVKPQPATLVAKQPDLNDPDLSAHDFIKLRDKGDAERRNQKPTGTDPYEKGISFEEFSRRRAVQVAARNREKGRR